MEGKRASTSVRYSCGFRPRRGKCRGSSLKFPELKKPRLRAVSCRKRTLASRNRRSIYPGRRCGIASGSTPRLFTSFPARWCLSLLWLWRGETPPCALTCIFLRATEPHQHVILSRFGADERAFLDAISLPQLGGNNVCAALAQHPPHGLVRTMRGPSGALRSAWCVCISLLVCRRQQKS